MSIARNRFDHESGIFMGEAGHVELKTRVAINAGDRTDFGGLAAAGYPRGDPRPTSGSTAILMTSNQI
jgi:hypothetical protein